MKPPNTDYRLAYRHGYFVDKHQLRAEHESAWVVAWAIGLALMIGLAAIGVYTHIQFN